LGFRLKIFRRIPAQQLLGNFQKKRKKSLAYLNRFDESEIGCWPAAHMHSIIFIVWQDDGHVLLLLALLCDGGNVPQFVSCRFIYHLHPFIFFRIFL
jgi:hypothetical protein